LKARLRAADVLPLVAAASIPLVFLHAMYQWHAKVGPVDIYGSDVAIALVVASAAAAGVLFGWQPLGRMRVVWILMALLFGLFVVACFWQPVELPKRHLTTAAKMIDQRRRELRLPYAYSLVTELNATEEKHFRQIAEAELVAQSPGHHEGDDVRWILGPVQESV